MENRIEKDKFPFVIAGSAVLLFGKSILKVGFILLYKTIKFLIKGIFIY